jgi:RimJ/RimL family protein N-acetyltransferase
MCNGKLTILSSEETTYVSCGNILFETGSLSLVPRIVCMTIDATFTHFPSLTTTRLLLRQIQPDDAESLFAILSDSHEGNLRQRYYFQGRFEDEHYFGLLKDEWLGTE